ncbi:MAG: SDR family oxidoreductase [Acidimicrobiia bacterium]
MILDLFRLDGKVAVVTAGGRGIGAACARAFAEAGADVAISARTAEQLEEVATDVRALGRRCLVIPANLDDLDNLDALAQRTADEFGRIDIVVNNVGGSMPAPLTATDVRALEQAFHFNVSTAFALTQAALPHLVATGNGSIINITSLVGRLSDRGFAAYGTAKAALAHMTRLLAADCAPKVRVNGIAPGSIATSALEMVLTMDELRDEMIVKTPLKRLGVADDIAAAALYLASDAGAFMTGKILEVDGGLEHPNLDMHIPDL